MYLTLKVKIVFHYVNMVYFFVLDNFNIRLIYFKLLVYIKPSQICGIVQKKTLIYINCDIFKTKL